jgi:antitoxin component YwqK of YwqJK toxin-antitoxin module
VYSIQKSLVVFSFLLAKICACQVNDIVVENDTTYDDEGKISYILTMRYDPRGSFYEEETTVFSYFENDVLKEKTFNTTKNNVQYVFQTEYYENGNKHLEYSYYVINRRIYGAPKLDSLYYVYDTDGVLDYVSSYKMNKREGWEVHYYKDGKIESEREYRDDRLWNVRFYSQIGESLNTGEFVDGNGELISYVDGYQAAICLYINGKQKRKSCWCE